MIGIAHAGWKGTVDELLQEMIEHWECEGIVPK